MRERKKGNKEGTRMEERIDQVQIQWKAKQNSAEINEIIKIKQKNQ